MKMNNLQALIDRQIGFYSRLNYDSILKRLVVNSVDSYYGLENFNTEQIAQDPNPIFACRFAETAGYEHILALANESGRVAIQDTSKPNTDNTLVGYNCHNNAVFDLAWMPKQMIFLTVSGDHTACLWDLERGTPERVQLFTSHTRSVKTAAFQPLDTHVFATGGRDGHVYVWDVRAGRPGLHMYWEHIRRPDNCLNNCHSLTRLSRTPGSHSKRSRLDTARATSITGLVFQDHNSLVSCGEFDGNIKVWDLRKNYSIMKREPLPKHSIPYCGSSTKNGYTNLIVDDAGMRLYASCMDDVIYCFNVSTYNSVPEQRYIGHENSSFYIKTSLSPDCKYLVSGSSDKNAYVWNVKYSEPVVKLVGHWAEVTCAAWCRLGDVKVATASDDSRHKIWRLGPEFRDDELLQGKAEVVLHTDVTTLPQWGNIGTPKSLKRRQTTTPMSNTYKRSRTQEQSTKKTKRCLMDMMNAFREQDDSDVERKRMKTESQQENTLPICSKRHTRSSENQTTPEKKRKCDESNKSPPQWTYLSKPGTSFMSPTKHYDKACCKKLTPVKRRDRTPDKSPDSCKLRIISVTSPTKNLPNFVLDGEAPHQKLMSPMKKRENSNWLIQITKDKKSVAVDKTVLSSLKDNIPTRRNSTTEKPPKSTKNKSILSYFNVKTK